MNHKNDEFKTCKCCGEIRHRTEFGYQKKECRVCDYINTHEDNNILRLSEEEYKNVLYLMLNGKLNYINDLCDILNIPLDEAILAIKTIGTRNGRNNNSYLIKHKCDQCNKDIETSMFKYEGWTVHFCNKECHDNYKTGKRRIPLDEYNNCFCEWCGDEFHRKKSHIERKGDNFCSMKCSQEYYKNITAKTDEHIQKGRETALNNLKNGLYKTDSGIQLITNDLLNKLNIKYEDEYIFGNYSFDNYLEDYDLFIEVMGGYWHSDPRSFDEISFFTQKDRIRRDKSKRSYSINRNKQILYLWEYDINNNLLLCEKLIELYIKNKGVLEDYNSFNYSIVNGNILLSKIIIKPYIDYTIEELHEITDLSVKQRKDYYITFICDECGEKVTRLKSKYGDFDTHFCSVECRNTHRANILQENNNVKCSCDFCGIEINKKLSEYNNHEQHFCSKECYDNFQSKDRVIRICKYCGEEILVKKSEINRNITGEFFCNKECYYDNKAKIKKENIMIYKCDLCGKDCETTKNKYKLRPSHFCSVKCSNTFKNKHMIKQRIIV